MVGVRPRSSTQTYTRLLKRSTFEQNEHLALVECFEKFVGFDVALI